MLLFYPLQKSYMKQQLTLDFVQRYRRMLLPKPEWRVLSVLICYGECFIGFKRVSPALCIADGFRMLWRGKRYKWCCLQCQKMMTAIRTKMRLDPYWGVLRQVVGSRACFHCWSVLLFLLLWCSFLRDAVFIWPNRSIIITTVLSLPPNFGTLLPFSYQITDMSSVFEGEKLDSLQAAPTRMSICWIVVDNIVKSLV